MTNNKISKLKNIIQLYTNTETMTNNKQQTAVEWYGIQLGMLFRQYHIGRISITEFHTKRFEFEEQAKEMEKEQTMNFALEYMMQSKPVVDYYNETYGGNK